MPTLIPRPSGFPFKRAFLLVLASASACAALPDAAGAEG